MIDPSIGITQNVECYLELTAKVKEAYQKKVIFVLALKVTFMQCKAKVYL